MLRRNSYPERLRAGVEPKRRLQGDGLWEVEAPVALAPGKFTIPPNTAVELPPPADIDPNHVYSLVELIDIAQRRNPATRVAWEQPRQAAMWASRALVIFRR